MRVIFMGSPEFSVPILNSIIASGHDVIAVYCQPTRPAGRGKKEKLTPVQSHKVRDSRLTFKVYRVPYL